jgi:hypothetical protein
MTYEKYEYGPLDTYEIVWASGHIERIDAHQVIMPPDEMLSSLFGALGTLSKPKKGWMFHGEVDGRWRLLLTAPAEDIRSVRNVSHTRDQAAAPDA